MLGGPGSFLPGGLPKLNTRLNPQGSVGRPCRSRLGLGIVATAYNLVRMARLLSIQGGEQAVTVQRQPTQGTSSSRC